MYVELIAINSNIFKKKFESHVQKTSIYIPSIKHFNNQKYLKKHQAYMETQPLIPIILM